uniref:MPN domain-containing protein n=1 Tax=Candidatus Nitrotoga fabula TaxID=2182327 RepID=A0A2X0QSY8_9PROT|nr:conserved protein of unknown function [Candidatus Nitrotoga fabula]
MEPTKMSDQELIARIIGTKTATKLYQGRLTPLMLGKDGQQPHPKLAVSLELTRRLMREEIYHGPALVSTRDVSAYLIAHFLGRQYESFVVIFLDNQHRIITIDEMFRGTINSSHVYPREVVQAALKHNAAACIFAHNHPSGLAEPSRCDENLTENLKRVLALVDVRVLDHFVVGGEVATSFAERGLL